MTQKPWEYEKNKIAEPTVGRVVYYYRPPNSGSISVEPLAAIVAAVGVGGGPYTVNLAVVGSDGFMYPQQLVPHQSERSMASEGAYWDWMPFQKGQAAKTEELQKELDQKVLDAKTKGAK